MVLQYVNTIMNFRGETVANTNQILQGQFEGELTEKGFTQAKVF